MRFELRFSALEGKTEHTTTKQKINEGSKLP